MRKCARCCETKDENEFSTGRVRRDKRYLSSYCKPCASEMQRELRAKRKLGIEPEQVRFQYDDPRQYKLYEYARARARKKNIEFDITPDDIVIPEYCPLLGITLNTNVDDCGMRDYSPSLDRINPHKGYMKGNIWVISYRANTIKSNAHPKEIMLLAENLIRLYKKPD